MDEELILILKKHVDSLRKNCSIAGIVPIPSRTWTAKNKVNAFLSEYLQVPLFDNLLSWKEEPPSRQGELLNNDQRHHNVHQRMIATLNEPLPKGTLLLFDDYIGSGNTIKEAARALRATKQIPHELVPFTIATIKWHLGKPGFS
jgi:predicted amidophosphoribosyltransferase